MMNESKKYKLTKINSSHLFSMPKTSPEILKEKQSKKGSLGNGRSPNPMMRREEQLGWGSD
jgi:hypothetical protein